MQQEQSHKLSATPVSEPQRDTTALQAQLAHQSLAAAAATASLQQEQQLVFVQQAGEVQKQLPPGQPALHHQQHQQQAEFPPQQLQQAAPEQQQWLVSWPGPQSLNGSGSFNGHNGTSPHDLLGVGSSSFQWSGENAAGPSNLQAAGRLQSGSRSISSPDVPETAAGRVQLDVLGRNAATPAPLTGQATLSAGMAPQAAVQPAQQQPATGLPASPTMLQYQQQRQQQQQYAQLLQQWRASSGSSIGGSSTPSSAGNWLDVHMQQPAQVFTRPTCAAHRDNGENGESLLWPPAGALRQHSTSPHLLHQPGMPLGLQLHLPMQQQQRTGVTHQQQQQQSLLMTPPGTMQPGSSAGGAAATAAGAHAPALLRPPPIVIPSTQPLLLVQQQQRQQHTDSASAPAPSPAPPRSSTSVTPALHNMVLTDTPAAAAAVAAAAATLYQGGGEATTTISSNSGRPRRQRYRAALSTSPAERSAAAAGGGGGSGGSSAGPSGAAAMVAAGRQYIQVVCGNLTGWLDITNMMVVVNAGAQDQQKVNPVGFEALAGKGSTRKWRQSLVVLPQGLEDSWVPEPMPLGDLIKLHQLDRPAAAQPASQQAAAGRAAAASTPEASTISPAPQYSLVSPGMRRRRQQVQQHPLPQELGDIYAQTATVAMQGSSQEDEPVQAKRSRSSQAQQQQQQQPSWSQMQSWPSIPAFGATGWQWQQQQQQHQSQPARQRGVSRQQSAPLQQQQMWQAAIGHTTPSPSPFIQQQQQQHSSGTQSPGTSSVSPPVLPLPGLHWQYEPQSMTSAAAGGGVSPGPTSTAAGAGGIAAASSTLHIAGLEPQQPAVLQSAVLPNLQILGLHGRAGSLQQLPGPETTTPVLTGLAAAAQQPGTAAEQVHMQSGRLAEQQQLCLNQQLMLAGTSGQQQPTPEAIGARTGGSADAAPKDQGDLPLLSPAGRPLRQPALRQRAAAAAGRYERGFQPIGYLGGVRWLQVWCDQLPGLLDLQKMQVTPQQGQCEGQPMSLSAFEQLGGRGTARKWRRSLTTMDGGEYITLGEWLERYQILPGTEREKQHQQLPADSSKFSAAQRMVAGVPAQTATAAYASAVSRLPPGFVSLQQARDQQERHKQQQSQGQKQLFQQQEQPLALAVHPVAAFGGLLQQPQALLPIEPVAVDSSSLQSMAEQGTGPLEEAAVPNAAAAPSDEAAWNPDLWSLLEEYASELESNPELHLLPAQVERDLAEEAAMVAGAATGGEEPLPALDQGLQQFHWQQPQQQALQTPIGQQNLAQQLHLSQEHIQLP